MSRPARSPDRTGGCGRPPFRAPIRRRTARESPIPRSRNEPQAHSEAGAGRLASGGDGTGHAILASNSSDAHDRLGAANANPNAQWQGSGSGGGAVSSKCIASQKLEGN